MNKRILLVFLCCFFTVSIKAQLLSNDSLLSSSFNEYYCKNNKPRALMSFKERSFWYKINPVSYVSIGLMFGYQRFLSQQLGSECAYQITCSEHAKKAVERYGLFKGVMFGFYQLQSCTPKTGYDYPDHAINQSGEIINPIEINED